MIQYLRKIHETFSVGTTISYFQDSGRVVYIKSLNDKADSPLGIKINDPKEMILEKLENLYDQGNIITYPISLVPIHSTDPLGASIIFVLKI